MGSSPRRGRLKLTVVRRTRAGHFDDPVVATAILDRSPRRLGGISICFMAFVWTRRLTARSIIASIRSSTASSSLKASGVRSLADRPNNTLADGSPKAAEAGNITELTSLHSARSHAEVDTKFCRGHVFCK